MATEVDKNVPAAVETKEIKEDTPAENKAEEPAAAKTEDAVAAKGEPAPPKVVVHKQNFEKDVVYLYQFSRTPLLPSLSPYCLKVETWLRLAGLKYEVLCFFQFFHIYQQYLIHYLMNSCVKYVKLYEGFVPNGFYEAWNVRVGDPALLSLVTGLLPFARFGVAKASDIGGHI